MPYPNEHSARLRNPDECDKFRRVNGGTIYGKIEVPASISIIWGHLKGAGEKAWQPQALRFPKSEWTAAAAKKWLADHDIKHTFEPASEEANEMPENLQQFAEQKELFQVEVFRSGDYGAKGRYTDDDLQAMAADYKPELHEAPVTQDHAQQGPAHGWIARLRAVGGSLFADLRDVSEGLLTALKNRAYKKRSIELYGTFEKTGRPYVRAVSFLGAGIPAVKGMADIAFAENEKFVVIEFAEKPMKTEDGENYPAAAYAYVPDSDLPSTWKLRIWESPTLKVTRVQLGRAAAALSPGGFRGEKAEIPAGDLAKVKAKLRAAYRSLDTPDEEMPKAVKESGTSFRFMESWTAEFTDAIETKEPFSYTVQIIKPGLTVDKQRYYPAEVIARDGPRIFEGVRMHENHATKQEDQARPEGDVRTWVGELSNLFIDSANALCGEAKIFDPAFRAKLEGMKSAGVLNKMALSIRAVGECVKGNVDGKSVDVVERLIKARSVDFVTEGNAGGCVLFDEKTDVDLLDHAGLREVRPDLVELIEHTATKALATQSKIEKARLVEERDAAKAEVAKVREESERIVKLAEGRIAGERLLAEATNLPDSARQLLRERLGDDIAIPDKVREMIELCESVRAITVQAAEAAKSPPKGVTGLGKSSPRGASGEKMALRETMIQRYIDEGDCRELAEKKARIFAGE